MKKILVLLMSFFMIMSLAGCGKEEETNTNVNTNAADLVVYGNIYTSDETAPWAEAVAVKDGFYTYVGDAEGVKEFIGENTEVKEYKEGMITSGLVDSHSHGHSGGISGLFEFEMFDDFTVDEYVATLTAFIEENPDLDFYKGVGWANASFDQNGPTKDILDAVCAYKPVVIQSEDYHSYWANSKALEMAGITAETEDIPGGVISRNEAGEPMGTIRDNACGLIEAIAPTYSVEQYKEAILFYQTMALELGETMYFEPMVNLDGTEKILQAYNELDEAGELLIQTYGGYELVCSETTVDEVAHVAELVEASKGGMFELRDIKVLLDGVVEGKTAYLKEAYADEEDYVGEVLFDEETLTAMISAANKLGVGVHIHAIGDAAVTMALDCFESSQKETGVEDIRNAITHLQLVDPADYPRFKELNVIAALNPYWALREPGYFYDLEVPYLGLERAEGEYPVKSLINAGAVVTCASDYPVTIPPAPLNAIQTGVIRMYPGEEDTLLGPDERASVEELLKASTINSAYQMRCEDIRGSITVGKEADMTVLGTDITKCDPEMIDSTEILAVIIRGKIAFPV